MQEPKRFVDLKEQEQLIKQLEEIDRKLSAININHCRECGDTEPKHGFYPLLGHATGEGIYQRSGLLCNRCARTDSEYKKTFGEPKEIISNQ